mmetsp:Transcript_98/g.128  ORF Transcript_98/g.128 Transcript_98/m.128 type:complete len:580 (-) Transcript_98:98-1837(-)
MSAILQSSLRHPAVALKTISSTQIRTSIHKYYNPSSYSSVNVLDRTKKNVARLYARRALELAAASAATMVTTAQMEAQIEKPLEWSAYDLAEKRKTFGEGISSLGKTSIERIWAAGSRIVNLTLLASPLGVLTPLAYLSGPGSMASNWAWDYAIWSVEKAGPTFIKLFQWASTRNDIFPSEFINKFSTLQSNTRGHSWKETVSILEECLGSKFHDILEFEDSNIRRKELANKHGLAMRKMIERQKYVPIGSGCIAQVYKAKLKEDTSLLPAGSEVAVKVIHPNILHKVCVDFYILNKITSLLEKIPYLNLDYLSMKDSVQQFRDIMLPQLDLRVEANNLRRFRRDFSDDDRISFPLPLDDLTSNNVLVEAFVCGEPIMEMLEHGRLNADQREDLAKLGLKTVMKMIFMNDFVHGDLHPGNILVDKNIQKRGKPLRLNLIDCGLVVEMGENDHVNLVKILGALIKRDGSSAAQLMVDTAKKCQASALDVKLFCKGIQTICDDDLDNNFLESVGDYLADICYLACKHKVKLEASFINAALACEIMEGIASSLCPTLEVQSVAFPMVVKAELMHGLKTMKML